MIAPTHLNEYSIYNEASLYFESSLRRHPMVLRKSAIRGIDTPKADKKRQDILKSARHCFHKNGFHQTSMQQICAAVALGPGAVYRYFVSKQAIIEAMVEEERRQARAIMATLQATASLPETLDILTRAFATRDTFAGDTALMTEVYAEGVRNRRVATLIRKAEAEWIDGLSALLRTAQARGQIDPQLDARQTALFITAMWDGVALRRAFHPQEKDHAMAEFFASTLHRVLARDGRRDRAAKSFANPAQDQAVGPVDDADFADADLRQLSLI